ncbi:MAG: hypothetical protein CL916_02620 [Deltaproteobacteria bacterium]|nr:hypothetical protein [Deltaproteobacteria bacterium]
MLLYIIFFICALAQETSVWIGSLEIHVQSDGGSFVMKGYTDRTTWVPLPGESGTWPYSVRNQEENLLVIDQDGIPHAHLKEGVHEITGIFSWSDIPTHIKTPTNIGVISATSNNQIIPVYRSPNRIWLSPEDIPVQSHSIQILEHDDHIEYSIHSQGIEQPIQIPISLSPKQKLLAIETSMPYWLKNNILHMYLPQGMHTVKISLQIDAKTSPIPKSSITLNRNIRAETDFLVITDTWHGHREESILLYTENNHHLCKGDQSISITLSQPQSSPIAPLMTLQNIKDYTVQMQHPGDIRAFEQWPLASLGLWILCALMLWKNEHFQKRRLLLLSALLCVVLSPIALIFCICWIASKKSFSSDSDESLQIRTIAVFAIFAGIIMHSISPSTMHTIELRQITPNLYWIDSATICTLATASMAIFAFVAYKNIKNSILIAFFIGIFPQNSLAESGFPLCSIQLEDDSIIISGEVHLSQKGEWSAPGPIGSINIQKVIVDGTIFHSFRVNQEHYVSLFLPQGISEFEIHGTYNSPFGLQFPQQPARLDFFSKTHQIEGLNEDHSPQKTLFFWKDTSPDIIVQKPTLVMQVQVEAQKTSIQSTIINHSGTKTYHLPIWSDQSKEIITTSSQQVFPATDSHRWNDLLSTPSTLSFVPSSDQYNIKTYIHCSTDILCTHQKSIWNHSNILLPNQSIDIRPISRPTQNTWFLKSNHELTSSLSLWSTPKEISSSSYIINHHPRTIFFRLHILYLALTLLICFSSAFILAKHARSPLNIMEWLWILLGASFIHPLAVPFCILSFLALHNVWMKYLSIFAIGYVSYTTTFGLSSWKANENVVAVDESFLYQMLGIWLLGVFFFLHGFQLSQQTVKIGRSQT